MYFETSFYDISANTKKQYKFVFLSDLHDAENQPILDAIKKQAPDAVLVGGDFVHNEILYERGVEFLKSCAEYRPTFCSIGNHEIRCGKDMKKLVAPTGAVLLDNSCAFFEEIAIGGLTSGCSAENCHGLFKETPMPQTQWLSAFCRVQAPKILLSHHPEYYDKYLKTLPIELTLSGHAHGGQWRAFDRGLLAPGQGFFPKYTSGLYDGRFIVGRGIGNKSRFPRINNKPQIIVIRFGKLNDTQST